MNHPHEPQAAAMARAGELPDGEQLRSGGRCEICKCADWCGAHGCWTLRECIASGQVSAAQVVAHHDEFACPYCYDAGRDPNARALARETVAQDDVRDLPTPEPFGFLLPTERSPAFHYMRRSDEKGMSVFSADQMRAAIAVERAEVARLREALEEIAFAGMSPSPEMSQNGVEAWHARQAWRFIGIAARALNPTQGATNHD